MAIEIGDYGFLGKAPCFMKEYCHGVRHVLKRHLSRRHRQQGKQQLSDQDQPSLATLSKDRPQYYCFK